MCQTFMKLSRPARIEKGHFATKTKIRRGHNSIKTGHVGCHSEHQGFPTSHCYNYLIARRMNRLRRSIRACRRSLILKQNLNVVCAGRPLWPLADRQLRGRVLFLSCVYRWSDDHYYRSDAIFSSGDIALFQRVSLPTSSCIRTGLLPPEVRSDKKQTEVP